MSALAPLRFATANIKGWLPIRQLWVNLCMYALMLETRPDVLATQEMWPRRYRYGRVVNGKPQGGLRGILKGWKHVAPNRRAGTCVSLRPGLEFIDSGSRLLHKWVWGVCNARWIVWAQFRYGGFKIAAASLHFTPKKGSLRRARRAWTLGGVELADWIEDMVLAGCLHGAALMDGNCSSADLYEALGRNVHGLPIKVYSCPEGHSPTGKPIDHIVLWGNWEVTGRDVDESPRSDHDVWFIDARPV